MAWWMEERRQKEEVRWDRRELPKWLRWRRGVAGGGRVDMFCIYGCSVVLDCVSWNRDRSN